MQTPPRPIKVVAFRMDPVLKKRLDQYLVEHDVGLQHLIQALVEWELDTTTPLPNGRGSSLTVVRALELKSREILDCVAVDKLTARRTNAKKENTRV